MNIVLFVLGVLAVALIITGWILMFFGSIALAVDGERWWVRVAGILFAVLLVIFPLAIGASALRSSDLLPAGCYRVDITEVWVGKTYAPRNTFTPVDCP